MNIVRLQTALQVYAKNSSGAWGSSILDKITIESWEGEPLSKIVWKLKVTSDLCNLYGMLHGGAIMTMIDETTGMVLAESDSEKRAQVSVCLSSQYLNSAKFGDELTLISLVEKIGKSVSFSKCEVFQGSTLVATGTHVKKIFPIGLYSFKIAK